MLLQNMSSFIMLIKELEQLKLIKELDQMFILIHLINIQVLSVEIEIKSHKLCFYWLLISVG